MDQSGIHINYCVTFALHSTTQKIKTVKQLHLPCAPPPHSYLDDILLPSGDKPNHNTHCKLNNLTNLHC